MGHGSSGKPLAAPGDNTRRLHGSLGDAPPAELENAFYADQANRKLPVEIK
jgi:hypothetical protein